MSATWYAAFGLLALLGVLNALLLLAVMRQVGVLHQRVRPIPHGQTGGPQIGQHLDALDFESFTPAGAPSRETPLVAYAYVAPGCTVCDDLVPVLHAYSRSRDADLIDVALITGASPDEAKKYAIKHHVKLPLLRHDDVDAHWDIPGSPYVLALRPSESGKLIMLAGGIVNTMEQFEHLVQTAQDNVVALEQQGLGPALTMRHQNSTPHSRAELSAS